MAPVQRKDFSAMSSAEIENELIKFCIAERFEGDVAWLARLYDGEESEAKWEQLRASLISANPTRHPSIAPPESPIGETP